MRPPLSSALLLLALCVGELWEGGLPLAHGLATHRVQHTPAYHGTPVLNRDADVGPYVVGGHAVGGAHALTHSVVTSAAHPTKGGFSDGPAALARFYFPQVRSTRTAAPPRRTRGHVHTHTCRISLPRRKAPQCHCHRRRLCTLRSLHPARSVVSLPESGRRGSTAPFEGRPGLKPCEGISGRLPAHASRLYAHHGLNNLCLPTPRRRSRSEHQSVRDTTTMSPHACPSPGSTAPKGDGFRLGHGHVC
jgi:hypothetical protein